MDEDSRRSTRRVESSAKQKQKDALRLMQEARRSGKAYKPNLDDLHEDLYKEVNEDEYNEIVRQRQNDFVIDDDGAGYVDHGADIFDDDYEDDDYGDVKENKKKKKKKEDKPKKGAINSFFSAAPAPKAKVDESQVKLDEDDLLKDTLALLADECLEPDFEAPVVQNHVENSNPFRVKRPAEQVEDEMAPRPISKRVRLTTTDPVRRPPKVELTPKKLDSPAKIEKAVPMDDDDDFDDGFESPAFTTENEEPAIETKMEVEEPVVVEKKIKISEANWNYEEEPAVNISVQAGQEAFYIKENEQQMIRMYWLDAYEDNIKHPGTIYLFGRVFIKDIVSASCAVVVTNVERQVFFLPKDMSDDQDVYEEIKTCLERIRVSTFKCRKVQKKFMNDGTLGEGDHEKELDVFEIRYDSKHPVLSRDLTGKHFQSIFNTTTTALERILVEQGMMGPGWLDITNYTPVTAQRTYCDYEFTVDMERMKNIAYNTTEQRLPPLAKMVALNVVTSLNGTEKEICMVSALYNPKCALTNPSTERKHLQRFCVLTKTASVSLPFNLESQFKSLGLRAVDEVKIMPNETKLLYVLLAKLAKWEPDIIMGHDLGALIDLLKDRLKKHNVNGWDKICRLRRTAKIGTVKESKAGHWELTAGRLLLDSRLLAMELVRSRSFDLTELASLLLNVERKEIYANEISSFYGRSDRTIDLINWSWEDPYIALRIIAHLNALPLALQITNIVGGVTSRTLMGGRAERNEYLLLHAFHKSNIIAPNKYQSKFKEMKNKPAKKEDDCEAGNEEHAAEEMTSKNKAQYAGGLVLEPKKGLYDTLILLLDFNSLYPSIIQEFNICFTTVQHTKDSNDLPEVPSSGLPEGVLPKEIRGLVERRRQVKSLMKDKNISESKKKQYDIRQMALKLTANSMYGCLGFQQSRFYAKPLAALITAKGREILMHSKELVEKMGYTVVYGDTDSIMINTNSTDLAQAKKLGFEIKRAVNQCHRLLELDLDGVFKRMLLLKKKKYAALTVNPDDEKDMKKELKGLDIVRRDWSLLAKQSGTEIVDLILNPALSREELVSEIVDSLKMLRKKLDEGEIDTKMFEISKQLTRNVKEYKDLKSQPHASVAMRLNESGKFALKQGDIVEYVICEDGTTNPATQRAYHKTELADRKDLKIDLHYYLAQQVHPVVSRLCAPIEETDAVLIAESLGLDSTSYRRSALAAAAHEASEENELGYAGPVTYDHCESLHFPCPQCQTAVRIRSCTDGEEGNLRFSLEKCEKCEFVLYSCDNVIANLIRNSMMEYVEKHHTAIWRCDEAVCGYETASHLVRWNREGMECPKCSGGILRKSYTDKDLFDQQNFFRICVDIDKALKQVKPDDRRQLMQRPGYTHIRKLYLKLLDVVDEYLTHNSYNRVDLAYLFAPMLKI